MLLKAHFEYMIFFLIVATLFKKGIIMEPCTIRYKISYQYAFISKL